MESAIKRIRANVRSSLKTDFQPSQPVRFVPKADVLMFYNHETAPYYCTMYIVTLLNGSLKEKGGFNVYQ